MAPSSRTPVRLIFSPCLPGYDKVNLSAMKKALFPRTLTPGPWGRGAAACIQVCLERAKGKIKVSSIHAESMETHQRRKSFSFFFAVIMWLLELSQRKKGDISKPHDSALI